MEPRSDYPVFGVLLVGASRAGKTSLWWQLDQKRPFLDEYKPTLGTDFKTIELHVGAGPCRLLVWDTSGAASSVSMTRSLFVRADVVVAVVDLAALAYAIEMADGAVGTDPAPLLVAARLDLLREALADERRPMRRVGIVLGTKFDSFAPHMTMSGRDELIAQARALGAAYYDTALSDRATLLAPFQAVATKLTERQLVRRIAAERPLAPDWARAPLPVGAGGGLCVLV